MLPRAFSWKTVLPLVAVWQLVASFLFFNFYTPPREIPMRDATIMPPLASMRAWERRPEGAPPPLGGDERSSPNEVLSSLRRRELDRMHGTLGNAGGGANRGDALRMQPGAGVGVGGGLRDSYFGAAEGARGRQGEWTPPPYGGLRNAAAGDSPAAGPGAGGSLADAASNGDLLGAAGRPTNSDIGGYRMGAKGGLADRGLMDGQAGLGAYDRESPGGPGFGRGQAGASLGGKPPLMGTPGGWDRKPYGMAGDGLDVGTLASPGFVLGEMGGMGGGVDGYAALVPGGNAGWNGDRSAAAMMQPPFPPLLLRYPTTGDPVEDRNNKLMRAFDLFIKERDTGTCIPFYTIIVTVFNQDKFVDETLESVARQTYPHWELILVDDGSSDDTWRHAQDFLMRANVTQAVRAVRKRNGGLADARNLGMMLARGSWLLMLEGDDLLASGYLQSAADLIMEDCALDIVAGCMRTFGAVESDWCFPEGFSLTGAAYGAKFHGSVVYSRRLAEQVGGYNPALPWGLEDWNFWLFALARYPKVGFVPDVAFLHRTHAGGTLRSVMAERYAPLSAALVRTNHERLFEAGQLVRDLDTISHMAGATLERLEKTIMVMPKLPAPYFWRAQTYLRQGEYQKALADLQIMLTLGRPQQQWTLYYSLARAHEKLGNWKEALDALNIALRISPNDAVLRAKYALEQERLNPAALAMPGHVHVAPPYWSSAAAWQEMERGTLTGQLAHLERLQQSLEQVTTGRSAMLTLLRFASTRPPCREQTVGGFQVVSCRPRPGTRSQGCATMRALGSSEQAGAMQNVALNQKTPHPVVIKAWSRAEGVSGAPDKDYSLYLDIAFVDGTFLWAQGVSFDTGTHDWQERVAYVDADKPILSIDVYCMFRYHEGAVWFDDVLVAELALAICVCPAGEIYSPSSDKDCQPCVEGDLCIMGEHFVKEIVST
eukprot:jgi/Mesvir1/28063/Mv26199-RA.2